MTIDEKVLQEELATLKADFDKTKKGIETMEKEVLGQRNNLNAILVGKCYQKSKNDFICFEKTEFLLNYLQSKNFRK